MTRECWIWTRNNISTFKTLKVLFYLHAVHSALRNLRPSLKPLNLSNLNLASNEIH
jgi:hypothetical protein